MNKRSPGLVVAVLLAFAVVGYVLFLRLQPAPSIATAPAPPPAAPETAPAMTVPPQIRHPLDADSAAALSEPPPMALPALAEADSVVQGALGDLLGRRATLQLLQTDRFIQRVVATVDNLPTRQASPACGRCIRWSGASRRASTVACCRSTPTMPGATCRWCSWSRSSTRRARPRCTGACISTIAPRSVATARATSTVPNATPRAPRASPEKQPLRIECLTQQP